MTRPELNEWQVSRSDEAALNDRNWVELARSDLRSLSKLKGIFDVNAEVTDGALDLRVAEQDLYRTQIARSLIDDRCFGTPKRVGSVLLGLETYAGDPLANKASILSRAYVAHVVVSTGKDEVIQGAATSFEPSEQRPASGLDKLELHRSLRLLLHHDNAIPDPAASDDIRDAHLHYVTSPQLAVDGKVEELSISEPPVLIEPEADSPDLLRLERPLRAITRPSFQGRSSWKAGSNDECPIAHLQGAESARRQ